MNKDESELPDIDRIVRTREELEKLILLRPSSVVAFAECDDRFIMIAAGTMRDMVALHKIGTDELQSKIEENIAQMFAEEEATKH